MFISNSQQNRTKMLHLRGNKIISVILTTLDVWNARKIMQHLNQIYILSDSDDVQRNLWYCVLALNIECAFNRMSIFYPFLRFYKLFTHRWLKVLDYKLRQVGITHVCCLTWKLYQSFFDWYRMENYEMQIHRKKNISINRFIYFISNRSTLV